MIISEDDVSKFPNQFQEISASASFLLIVFDYRLPMMHERKVNAEKSARIALTN